VKKQPYGSAGILSKLLDPFPEPPPEFPRKIGVFVYNADFDYLEKYSLSAENIRDFQEQLSKLHEGKTWYSVFRRMTDRAIEGKKSTQSDKKILRDVFRDYEDYEVRDEQDNGRWFPFVSTKVDTSILASTRLLFKWVYYVWRGKIEIRRCKAKDCDRIFKPVRSDQEYCSKRCAKRFWAQTHLER